jgi:hypothetical protein
MWWGPTARRSIYQISNPTRVRKRVRRIETADRRTEGVLCGLRVETRFEMRRALLRLCASSCMKLFPGPLLRSKGIEGECATTTLLIVFAAPEFPRCEEITGAVISGEISLIGGFLRNVTLKHRSVVSPSAE